MSENQKIGYTTGFKSDEELHVIAEEICAILIKYQANLRDSQVVLKSLLVSIEQQKLGASNG